jgi:hypothetical protein
VCGTATPISIDRETDRQVWSVIIRARRGGTNDSANHSINDRITAIGKLCSIIVSNNHTQNSIATGTATSSTVVNGNTFDAQPYLNVLRKTSCYEAFC